MKSKGYVRYSQTFWVERWEGESEPTGEQNHMSKKHGRRKSRRNINSISHLSRLLIVSEWVVYLDVM